jgi:hypothetical protein
MSHLPPPPRREAPGARRRSSRGATSLLSKPSDQLLSVLRISDQPPPEMLPVAPPNFLTSFFSGGAGCAPRVREQLLLRRSPDAWSGLRPDAYCVLPCLPSRCADKHHRPQKARN